MKGVIIAIVAILILCGAGGGVYFYMAKNNPAEAKEADAGHEEAKAEEEGGTYISKLSYVQMQPIILPIIDNAGLSQTVSLVVAIEVDDPTKADKVKEVLPKLTDAYLSDMYGSLSKKAAMDGGVVRVSLLKERLVKVTNKVLGAGIANDVLLQVLQQRPV